MGKIDILLVDDHQLVRNAIRNILESQDDFNIIGEFGNGKEALEFIKESKPQVVLMDLNMPEMDGIEATKQIKNLYPEILIIILTVSDTEINLSETLKAGATGYLLKDATPDKLFTTIRSVVAGGSLVHDEMKMQLQEAKKGKIEILLVDDHQLVRNAIRNILETQEDFKIIGESGNGKEAMEFIKKERPQIVLMDLNMPEMDGIEATKQIKKLYPEVSIIILTVSDTEISISETLKAGATGYLLKDATPDKLFTTIRHVSKGGALVQDDLMMKLLNEFKKLNLQSEHTQELLTPREVEVLKMVAEGHNNKEIGEILFISEKTVKNHLHNVYEKLEVKDRIQAITKAREKKIF